jgi:high-affinity iron transporter
MIAALVIVFREILEAALIIGVVVAATSGVTGRGLWITAGAAGGVIGACVVASFADALADAAEGMGQELFNAGVLLVAVVMLTRHNGWMARQGRAMAQDARALGAEIAAVSARSTRWRSFAP